VSKDCRWIFASAPARAFDQIEVELMMSAESIRKTTKKDVAWFVRPVRATDDKIWERLRCELWPDGQEDHAGEIATLFAGKAAEPDAVLIAKSPEGKVIGFAELAIRMNLPTLIGTRVGYVEGLYVISEVRGLGVTRSLLRASRDWARQQNCAAFASDRAERIIIDRRFREK
jgi:aminoglycoside 6'-N-acetyltransferase I